MRPAVILLAAAGAGLALYFARAQASVAEEDVGTADEPTFSWLEGGDLTAASHDQNVIAFLAMIRAAEGTASADGYRALFGYLPSRGGPLFDSFEDHPRVRTYEKADEFIANGKKDFTTAAGAYQITATTYDRLRARLGLSDFSPEAQDAIATELLRENGALVEIQAGNFSAAIAKVGAIWASLPSSPYPQGKRSEQFVKAAYEAAGGVYA